MLCLVESRYQIIQWVLFTHAWRRKEKKSKDFYIGCLSNPVFQHNALYTSIHGKMTILESYKCAIKDNYSDFITVGIQMSSCGTDYLYKVLFKQILMLSLYPQDGVIYPYLRLMFYDVVFLASSPTKTRMKKTLKFKPMDSKIKSF